PAHGQVGQVANAAEKPLPTGQVAPSASRHLESIRSAYFCRKIVSSCKALSTDTDYGAFVPQSSPLRTRKHFDRGAVSCVVTTLPCLFTCGNCGVCSCYWWLPVRFSNFSSSPLTTQCRPSHHRHPARFLTQ